MICIKNQMNISNTQLSFLEEEVRYHIATEPDYVFYQPHYEIYYCNIHVCHAHKL